MNTGTPIRGEDAGTVSQTPWHATALDEVFARTETRGVEGLGDDEAVRRLARDGPNRLRMVVRRGWAARLAAQFNNVLIYVLMGSAVVTALLNHWADTSVIIGVVVINALIGFIQEGKAERALEAIRDMLAPQAMVIRDGKRMLVGAEDLVVGDVVFVESGDKVPADMRLFKVKNLQCQEAALTGESLPVSKAATAVAEDAALGDRKSMAYAGTLVATGQALGVVVATGQTTEIGRISTMLSEVEVLETPLLRQLARFSRWLTAAILAVAGATFAFGVMARGYGADEMFTAAVGLAVAAIPEGLPAIMTITLAIGVQRMARRNAVIRRLPAVETLGAVTVICSDKTGTLTRNEMTVQTVVTADHLFAVSGAGYLPAGAFYHNGAEADLGDHPLLRDMVRGALLCGDATVHEVEGEWICDGDPTEGALVVAAMKAGLTPSVVHATYPRTDVIPFESEHKFMATLHHDAGGAGSIFVKGAPERILEMCARQHGRDGEAPIDPAYWMGRMAEVSEQGQRVLALARRDAETGRRDLSHDDLRGTLTLYGLFGLADPPRQEAILAIEQCHAAGVRVKMITGDHAGTALAIARQIGLANAGAVLTGVELDGLDDAELQRRARITDVFARTSPAHKLRLVSALQACGEVTAMTGDGVNDAPALKRADVGVAMGMKGTEASKDVAEMVLADDNFASIAHAVEEGRTVYDNLIKAIVFILPTNGAEALAIIAAIAMGGVLPITAVQILWVNMITAVTLALALAFEPTERGVMRRPPRDASDAILSGFLVWRTAFVALLGVVCLFTLFQWELDHGASLEAARSVAVSTLVVFEVFYLFNSRFLREPVLNVQGLFGSRIALGAVATVMAFQVLFVYWGPAQMLFGTGDIGWDAWARIVAVASIVLFVVEIEKTILRRWRKRRAKAQ
ncbi:MAG: cation-transporting P-type ATPase [Alphaproteobacteria bacterium]|nr:cation-transporting P-type ATPase [Alphaproteobacteria bacterium]